jgi:hypothetical protein
MVRFEKHRQNLCIVDNRVYSYETHVATVVPHAGLLVEHGKWSATTSRHVSYVARELGLLIVPGTKESVEFID